MRVGHHIILAMLLLVLATSLVSGGAGDRASFTTSESEWGIHFSPVLEENATVVAIRWSFGDGQTSRSLAPTHYYREPGDYPVVMSVILEPGGNLTASQYVHVGERSSLVKLLHSVEVTDQGLWIWLNGDRMFWPEMGLLVGGGLLLGNAYISNQEARQYRKRGIPDHYRSWRQFEMFLGCLFLVIVAYIEIVVKGGYL